MNARCTDRIHPIARASGLEELREAQIQLVQPIAVIECAKRFPACGARGSMGSSSRPSVAAVLQERAGALDGLNEQCQVFIVRAKAGLTVL